MKGVKILINFNANINEIDSNRWTALMKVSKQGQKEIVELLLKNKADINIKNINGETALIWG